MKEIHDTRFFTNQRQEHFFLLTENGRATSFLLLFLYSRQCLVPLSFFFNSSLVFDKTQTLKLELIPTFFIFIWFKFLPFLYAPNLCVYTCMLVKKDGVQVKIKCNLRIYMNFQGRRKHMK